MRKKEDAIVISQAELSAGIYDLKLSAPAISSDARPGQFVNVYCADKTRLLPRPISLAGIDPERGEIRLVYRVSGAGTEEFSRLQPGDAVEVLGPLGNGFPLDEIHNKRTSGGPEENPEDRFRTEVFLIGGGIGIPPLLETAKALKKAAVCRDEDTQDKDGADGIRVTAVLGYRDSDTFLAEAFEAVCDCVLIASEDGSAGTKGTVLDAMREAGVIPKRTLPDVMRDASVSPDHCKPDNEKGADRAAGQSQVWFACGPTPMLRALKASAAVNGIACWLSLEERMACGVGACLACVCRTAEKDEHSQVKNRRVCKDGPVFRAEEITL